MAGFTFSFDQTSTMNCEEILRATSRNGDCKIFDTHPALRVALDRLRYLSLKCPRGNMNRDDDKDQININKLVLRFLVDRIPRTLYAGSLDYIHFAPDTHHYCEVRFERFQLFMNCALDNKATLSETSRVLARLLALAFDSCQPAPNSRLASQYDLLGWHQKEEANRSARLISGNSNSSRIDDNKPGQIVEKDQLNELLKRVVRNIRNNSLTTGLYNSNIEEDHGTISLFVFDLFRAVLISLIAIMVFLLPVCRAE